jgi:hypothetical protein
MTKGTMVTASRVNPRHVITRNSSFFKMLKVPNNEGGSGGIGKCDEDNVSESETCANEQDDHLIGEAEDAVDNLVEDADEAVEQRQDDRARGQDVEADIQQEEYEDGNGQVQGGRLLRQRRAPRWHEEYEMGEDY